MNIHRFSIAEMYSNSQGKTSASLLAGHVLIATACFMGIRGAVLNHGETMSWGFTFATLGAALLGIRRFTSDKQIPHTAESEKNKEP